MYIVLVSTNTITSAHLRAPHHFLHRNAYYCMCSAHIVHCSVLSITHCTHIVPTIARAQHYIALHNVTVSLFVYQKNTTTKNR